MSEQETREHKEIESTTDLGEFVNRFYESKVFKDGFYNSLSRTNIEGYSQYREVVLSRVASLDEKVDEKEVFDTFLETDQAKQLLLAFAQNDLKFEYDPDQCTPKVKTAFTTYQNAIRAMESSRYKALASDALCGGADSKERIEEADQLRQHRHNRLATALQESGIVASYRMARTLARIMMVSIDMDTFDSIQADEKIRFKILAGL
ncbi:MAG: hypothetical protein ABIB61_00945 [Candidatus Shapirobacteria bacterium]